MNTTDIWVILQTFVFLAEWSNGVKKRGGQIFETLIAYLTYMRARTALVCFLTLLAK